MPYKCSVPASKSNYDKGNTAHVFRFPNDESQKAAWARAIPRKDFAYTANSRVCEKHFQPSDIIWESSFWNEKTGVLVIAPLSKPRLKAGAVPSIFPDCPSYLSSTKTTTSRLSPNKKRIHREETAIAKALEASLASKSNYDKERYFHDIPSLTECLSNFPCSKFWDILYKKDYVLFMNITQNEAGVPQLNYAITINDKCLLQASCRGQTMTKISEVGIMPLSVRTVNDIFKVLDVIEALESLESTESISNLCDIVQSLLDSLLRITESDGCTGSLKFISEQVSFLTCSPERYRYSTDMLIFASMFFLISPQAYKFVRSSGNIVLPHPSTIRRLNSNFQVNPMSEVFPSNFLGYIKQKAAFLKPHELYISLMIDEIHLQQYFDYKGGVIVGSSHDSAEHASSAHVFMVQSMLSKYKDVAHILPTKTVKAGALFDVIRKIILGLEEVGFKVIVVVTDNNSINRKAMSHFCPGMQVNYIYPHPADKSRPLFYAIDSVHLIKCIRNNWLNQKNADQGMCFPSFDGDSMCVASFGTLRKLYEVESGNLLKYGYCLSRKALWPSNLERQNVGLALQVFSEQTARSLEELGTKNDLLHFKTTAAYINTFVTWFKIVNVKTPYKGEHSRDVMCTPLTDDEGDEKLYFLCKFLDWLEKWEETGVQLDSGKLTKETHAALKQTTNCLIQLTKYCISELDFTYVLPGKVQTDDLESRFGWYRRMAGTQYHVSLTQLYEIEQKIRTSTLLKLSLHSSQFGEFNVDAFVSDDTFCAKKCEAPFNITVTNDDIEKIQDKIPVITYLAGYCVRSALKKYDCAVCRDNLLTQRPLEVDDKFKLIEVCDRGGLLYPAVQVINAIAHNYVVVQKLVSAENEQFLKLPNQVHVAASLTFELLLQKEMTLVGCESSHSDKISCKILRSSCNTLLKNYCKLKNDKIQKGTKRKLNTITKP